MPGALVKATPGKIASAVTGTGTGPVFCFQGHNGDFSAVFEFVGSGTGLTVDLQISLDGGTNWGLATNLITTLAAPQIKTVTPVIAGALYRPNFTAVASGTTDLWVCSN